MRKILIIILLTLCLEEACLAFRISIKDKSGLMRSFEVEQDTTIKDLKKKIAAEIGSNESSVRLIYESKLLDESKALQDYGIDGDSILHSIFSRAHGVPIGVFVVTGYDKIALQVDPNDSILSLKQKVSGATGILVEHQRLIFGEQLLSNEETVHHYAITDGVDIDLISRQNDELVEILIVGPGENRIRLNVSSSDSIESVKRKISLKFSQDDFVIYNEGLIVLNSDTIAKFDRANSPVFRLTHAGKTFKITVSCWGTTGARYTLNYDDKISTLKEALHERYYIRTDDLILYLDDQLMEDGRTFGEYNITADSEITVVPRLGVERGLLRAQPDGTGRLAILWS